MGTRSVVFHLLIISSFFTLGCSPTYVLRAAFEQSKILLAREPIEEVLESSEISEETRLKLKIARDARVFANQMDLKVGGAFSDYVDVQREVLTWVVVGAKKDSFQLHSWWFPIVGSVPYKGFFDKDDAVKEAIEHFARKEGRKSGRISELLAHIKNVDTVAGDEAAELFADFKPRLLLNRVRNKRQLEEGQRFISLVKEYLSTEMQYIGYVRSDSKILDACERRRPIMIDNPKAPAARDLCNVLMKGLKVKDRLHRFDAENCRKMADIAKLEAKFW